MKWSQLWIGRKVWIDGVIEAKVSGFITANLNLRDSLIVQLDNRNTVWGTFGRVGDKPTCIGQMVVHRENLYPDRDETKDVYR